MVVYVRFKVSEDTYFVIGREIYCYQVELIVKVFWDCFQLYV